MKIIHLIFLVFVGSTRAKVVENTLEDELYAIIEQSVYQEIVQTTITQQKTTILVSGPSVDKKKPWKPKKIWKLIG